MDFKGKNCLITGATGGLGTAISMEMAALGCNLFLTSRLDSKLEILKERIQKESNVEVFCHSGNLHSDIDVQNIIFEVRNAMDSISVLVNCAGIFIIKDIENSTIRDYEETLKVNVKAPFVFCKEFSKDMVNQKWGRIVNIGSSSSYNGNQNTVLYCLSKHALLGLSKSINEGLKGHNVRVFCVSPSSMMNTDMSIQVKDQDHSTFLDPNDVAKYISFIISFDGNLTCDETRLNRMIIR